jgi:alpha-L-rhamnosidase
MIPFPIDLRLEYLRNPLGVDTPQPRFSWILNHSERNQQQTAYQILVASSGELVENEKADCWDSGKVVSDQTVNIEYQGKPLESGNTYFWCAKWWDKNNHESSFSKIVFFQMGLLQKNDWCAKWISKKNPRVFYSKGTTLLGKQFENYRNTFAIYLRKEFELKQPIKSATVFICGLGFYELTINGKQIGNQVLDPGQTDYEHVALYSTFDITDYLSKINAIGVILGNGRFIKNYGYDNPKLIVQFRIEYENGDKVTIITDKSWKVSHGPLMENGLYYGEKYDARHEMSGWDQTGFDGTKWESAIEVKGSKLKSQMMPPIRVAERIKPVEIFNPQNGIFVFDFGQNFTGWVKLSVTGPRGTEIKLRHAELIFEDGALNVSPNQSAEATEVYILKGGGLETFEPKFTCHGFRYVEVTGFPGVPTLDTLVGCFVHSDVEKTGEFICSNPLINQIHQNILWGQLSNLTSIPTDCPQRDERYGWLGDVQLAAEESMFNFDMAAFYSKFLDDIRFAQDQEGALPDTVPPYLGKYLLYPADPGWGTAYITLAWQLYFFYGDTRILQDHYSNMKKYVEFLRSNSENNILKTLGKYGDWCPPGSIGPKKTPVELTATFYYYHDVFHFAKIAEILNKTKDVGIYLNLAEQIKRSFNEEYFEENQYKAICVSKVDKGANQTSNVLPLALNMVPKEKKILVLERLLNSVVDAQDYHLDTGILGTRYLLEVLSQNGCEEIAYKVATQKTYPGWGYMISEGATTLWERWEKITSGGMNSHNHIMLGSVDTWFYKTIAGVSILKPGWKRIKIKPFPFKDLNYVSAKLQTVRGPLHVSWQKSAEDFQLNLLIPVGTSAEIFFPIIWENPILYLDDRKVWVRGIKSSKYDPDIENLKVFEKYIQFDLYSGYYNFKLNKLN